MVEYNFSDKLSNSVSNVIRKQILYEKIIELKSLFTGFVIITSIMGFTCIINGVYTNYLIWNIRKDIQEIKNINDDLNKKNDFLLKNNERNE
jgi:hypothetical protein